MDNNLGAQKISLNCSQWYVNHWTIQHALREFFSNFMDASLQKYPEAKVLKHQENENHIKFTAQFKDDTIVKGNFIEYDIKNKTLTMRNELSFGPERMLFGASSKKSQKLAIGQFGQGMKLAMIILLRNKMPVRIQSRQTIYYTTLCDWKLPYTEGKVLHIQIRPRQIDDAQKDTTMIVIKNVGRNVFEDFRYISLALLKPFSYQKIVMGDSQLIIPTIDQKIKGLILKKGIKVCTYTSDLAQKYQNYSYNLDFQLNRERSAAVNYQDFKKKQSKLHYDVCCNYQKLKQDNPALQDILDRHFQIIYCFLTRNKHETWYFHHFSPANKALCDKFYDKFLKQNQKIEAYPIQSAQQAINIKDKLKQYGLQQSFYPSIQVSWQLASTLYQSTKYQSIDNKIKKMLDLTNEIPLTAQQISSLNILKQQFSPLLPHISQFEFRKKNVENVACFKSPNQNQKKIYINQFELRNKRQKFIYALFEALRI